MELYDIILIVWLFSIFHNFIHRQVQRKADIIRGFSVFFHKNVHLSTISTRKTVHNVDKCKISA